MRKQDDSTIVTITFDGTDYAWNTAEPLKGSNWEDTSGNTLVSALVSAYETSPGPLKVTLSDGASELELTFVLEVEDTEQ